MLSELTSHVDSTFVECWLDIRRMLTRYSSHVDSTCFERGIELPRKLDQHASHVDSTCLQLFQKMRRNIFKNRLPNLALLLAAGERLRAAGPVLGIVRGGEG